MKALVVAGLVCLYIGLASAQTGGTIAGEVRDQTGALIPSATVTATNAATNVERSTQSNSAGLYSFPGLVPGRYQVKAAAAGFQTAVTNDIELQVQQTARVDFALPVGQTNQTLEVVANMASLSTDNATVGTVIEERRIMELPLNGRSFFSLVALSPNVVYGFVPPAQASGRLGEPEALSPSRSRALALHGPTTRSTASPTPISTSIPTSSSHRSTRSRSSRCKPASTPLSSDAPPDR